jgi:hypothetical protein
MDSFGTSTDATAFAVTPIFAPSAPFCGYPLNQNASQKNKKPTGFPIGFETVGAASRRD